eukprot:CAMPEP_0119043772 /NCGR_PEP_ID=MMETSP1177-20130426/25889_1 /TAXON_ID=2985 /ORGANISM="Ochromonas sp, Strain CCMP1899" /LENGTH=84 /DNA_ID=CAMNT_0007012663 /DNA_START=429 /DNA_END=680 /DNA_ORIENTATION=-
MALIQDIENTRMDRAKLGMLALAEEIRRGAAVPAAKLNNIGAIEIGNIRKFMASSMGVFNQLTTPVDGPTGPGRGSTQDEYNDY